MTSHMGAENRDTPSAVNATGHPGTKLSPPARFRLSTMALKQIALAKLTDITVISTEFHGETVVFEPWLSLLVDVGRKVLFTGVYQRSFEPDDDVDALPDLCWRRSEWIRDVDTAQVGEATDRLAYLAGDTQIASTIRFSRLDQQQALAALIHSSIDQFANGTTVTRARRPEANWHWLSLIVADETFNAQVEYSPLLAQSAAIETWIPRWLNGFESLDTAHAIQPDAEITISYRPSLSELLTAVLQSPS